MTPIIHKGIFKDMRDLNRTLPSPKMRDIGIGRAYRTRRRACRIFGAHAGSVHILGCCERGHENRLELMRQSADQFAGTLYMGTAGLLNLSYLAAMRPGAGIFFDINPVQTLFWEKIFDAAAVCPKVEDFITFLNTSPEVVDAAIRQLFGNKHYELFYLETSNKAPSKDQGGRIAKKFYKLSFFTARDKTRPELQWIRDGYEHFHTMAKARALGAITLDLADSTGWDQLAAYLSGKPVSKAAAIYISNILMFMRSSTDFYARPAGEKTIQRCLANIRKITDPDSRIIIDGTSDGLAASYVRGARDYPKPKAIAA